MQVLAHFCFWRTYSNFGIHVNPTGMQFHHHNCFMKSRFAFKNGCLKMRKISKHPNIANAYSKMDTCIATYIYFCVQAKSVSRCKRHWASRIWVDSIVGRWQMVTELRFWWLSSIWPIPKVYRYCYSQLLLYRTRLYRNSHIPDREFQSRRNSSQYVLYSLVFGCTGFLVPDTTTFFLIC